MNAKSMILGAAIAVVSSVIIALCVGRPKVLVEAPVTNSYSITNQVNILLEKGLQKASHL